MYVDYHEYIKSDEWKIRRSMALADARFRCRLCNSKEKTLHVHHRTYENLGNETLADLTVLCEVCHSKFHDIVSVESQADNNVDCDPGVPDSNGLIRFPGLYASGMSDKHL